MENDDGRKNETGRQKKILWIEDDSFLIGIISKKLSKENLELIYSKEGTDALALARKEQPALIVLDILLQGMDGIQVLSQLKADEETKHIPVIMFSNFDDAGKVEQSKKLGTEAFFVKASVNLDEIVAEIEKIISR